jgi:hypothetical protein
MEHRAASYPTAFAGWLTNMDFSLGPTLQLALVGSPRDEGMEALTHVVSQPYLPRLVIAAGEPGAKGTPSLLDGRDMLDDMPTAYLCQGFACKLPTTSSQELEAQLQEAIKMGSRGT